MTHGTHHEHDRDRLDHDRLDHDRSAESAHGYDRTAEAHDKYGGINWGAAFFGWLVAIAIAVLLSSIVGAIAAAVGSSLNVTPDDAEQQAGTIGLATAAALLAVLLIAYYAGGYVAGRMSRFDGGKQGLGVWIVGLLVTLIAAALGAVFGTEYNIMERVDLPTMPIPTEQLGWGAAITLAVILVGTLLAAMAGGKVGHRYHHKVDRAAHLAT